MELTARRRRAIAIIAASTVVVAVAAGYWLRGAVPPASSSAAISSGPPLPITVTGWQFRDRDHGWVLVNSLTDPISRLFATEDGGAHWRALGPMPGMLAFSFRFFDRSNGVVQARDAAVRTQVLFTADGGRTWRRAEPPPVPFAPGQVLFGDAVHAYLFTVEDTYASTDAARSWHSLPRAPDFRFLNPLGFRDALNGWATSGLQLVRTRDGGATWSLEALPSAPSPGFVLSVVAAGETEVLVADNRPGVPGGPQVYPSRDAGDTWEAARPAAPELAGQGPSSITAFADHDHWFVPAGTVLWSTADAGQTWVGFRAALPVDMSLGVLTFSSPTDGWTVTSHLDSGGVHPALLRTTDGGHHWREVGLPRL